MTLFRSMVVVVVLGMAGIASAQSLQGQLDAFGDSASYTVPLGPAFSGPLVQSTGPANALTGAAVDYRYSEFDAAASGAVNQDLLTNGTITDALLINALGTSPGQNGYAAISFEVTGSVSINTAGAADADNFAAWDITHALNLAFGGSVYFTGDSTDAGPTGAPLGNFTTALIAIQYGVPLPLVIATTANYAVASEGTIASSVDAIDLRIEWVGARLYDENLNLLEEGSIVGASGTVYPVPEPLAAGAIALGLVMVTAMTRRRRIAFA